MPLTYADLHPYEHRAAQFLLTREGGALWLDMGLGKTVSTLTAMCQALMLGAADAFFVVAPIRVIQTVWRQEALKWEHTRHLAFSLVYGNERQRYDALRKRADVYLINYENMEWLYRAWSSMPGFPQGRIGLVLDEASKIKAHRTKRFKALKRMLSVFSPRWELTGTPAPNSYQDIFSQIFVLDRGARFGDRFDLFRDEFFHKDDYMGYRYSLGSRAQQRLERLIAPLVLRLDARDYKQLPPVVRNDILLTLPPVAFAQYKELEKEFFLMLDELHEVEALNAATLSAKLWQFANGALYDTDRQWHAVHDAKLDALMDILDDAQGEPVLVAYWFKSDLARLKSRLGHNVAVFSESKNPEHLIAQWADRKVPIMLIHPQSGGHGIDRLQHGGHILAMFSQTWSLEMHDQLVARLNRQGQTKPVIVHYLLAEHTVDQAIRDAIATKSHNQAQLLDALRRYRHTEDLLS